VSKINAPGKIGKQKSPEAPGMMMKKRTSERIREQTERTARIRAQLAESRKTSGQNQVENIIAQCKRVQQASEQSQQKI
jgi:hypothetical protein